MRFSKSLRVFFFSLVATITLIAVTSAIVSLFYEKAVIRFMKKYLDEHLLTQLTMDDIRFRVLKGFPNATVEITNAVLLSGQDFARSDFSAPFADTLLQANSILFQFDLLKMFNKEYELKKIEVSRGKLNILFDKQNRHNMTIWKAAEISGQTYSVNLRSIVFNATAIKVISLREQFNMDALSEKTSFRGTFSGNVLSGETRGNFALSSLSLKNKRLLRNASLHLMVKMIYSGNRLRISQGRVQLNKAVATIEGEYQGGKRNFIDLILNIPKFGLAELMSLIPSENKPFTPDFEFTGNGKLSAVIKGSPSDGKAMLIRSHFELTNCTARNNNSKTSITDINLQEAFREHVPRILP